jgi:hypothetical protein
MSPWFVHLLSEAISMKLHLTTATVPWHEIALHAVPTDTPGLFSPDFTCGASGTGHFLLGLVDPHHHAPPLI